MSAPEVLPIPWCCQGAEECDGIRFNEDEQCFEFVLYLNDDGPCWHAAYACPLCCASLKMEDLMPPWIKSRPR